MTPVDEEPAEQDVRKVLKEYVKVRQARVLEPAGIPVFTAAVGSVVEPTTTTGATSPSWYRVASPTQPVSSFTYDSVTTNTGG